MLYLMHWLLHVCSDVDGEPVNLDDHICQQILSAAEALQYVELGDGMMPAGTSSYDVDADTSTPDHMTSNSDPDVVQVGDVFLSVKTDNMLEIVVFIAQVIGELLKNENKRPALFCY